MTILEQIDALAQAHGPNALAEAMAHLARAVRSQRKTDQKTLGSLAESFKVAMRNWDAQKAQNVPESERVADLEKTLRAAWPQTREWHSYCDRCQDTGWEFRICRTAGDCGRPFKLPGQRADDFTGQGRCAEGHSYVVPCLGCAKGEPFRRSLMRTAAPEDFAQAGKTKPTRMGR